MEPQTVPAAAGLDVAEQGQRLGQQRRVLGERGPSLQVGLGYRRADLDDVLVVLDPGAARQPRNVDEYRRLHQPHVEHRHQGLTAGE